MKTILVLLGMFLVAESRAAPVSHDALDDAAAAALMVLALKQRPDREHVGLLYEQGGTIARTPTQTAQRNAGSSNKGAFTVPANSLRGLFHNHPLRSAKKGASADVDQERFSPDDITQALKLGVPSYISVNERVLRYDPRAHKTEEVLARFPIEELLQHIAQRRSPQNPISAAEHNRGR